MKVMNIEERREYLADHGHNLQDGQTIYTILRSVSRSGMLRVIDLVYFVDDEPRYLTYAASQILEYKLDKNTGVKIRGAGMDMGFHLVDNLSAALGMKFIHRWL